MGTKILNSRWFYVVLSILLAFLLWVYVGNDPNSVDNRNPAECPGGIQWIGKA